MTEPHTFDWQAGGSGDTSWRGKSRQFIDDKPGSPARTLSTTKVPAVYKPDAPVEAYTERTRGEDGKQAEAVELPSLMGHTGKGGGGQDHFVHDRREAQVFQPKYFTGDEDRRAGGAPSDLAPTLNAQPKSGDGQALVYDGEAQAFLPRHYTRGKDGAPADTAPSLTKESDRGDGQAVVFNVVPGGNSKKHPNTLVANETDVAEALTAVGPARRSDRGTLMAQPDSQDAAALERLERDGYLPPVPYDPAPDGPRYAAMGDAVTVNVIEWIGVRLRFAVEQERVSG